MSDDLEIVRTARARGFRVLGTAGLAALLRPDSGSGSRRERPLRPDEVRDWMEWFGFAGPADGDDPPPRSGTPPEG